MSTNLNSIFYDSAVSSPTEPQLLSPEGTIDTKGGLSYISVYSAVMVFNPDFNFGNVVKRSSTGTTNGVFTSWYESDSESSPIMNTPLTRIEEIPLSPKSKPKTTILLNSDLKTSATAADLKKVYPESESNEPRIGTPPTRPKSNRKVNSKMRPTPNRIETVERLDRRCMLDRSNAQYNSILLSESQDEDQAGSCRSRQGTDAYGGLDDRISDYQKPILNSTVEISLPYPVSNNSSSSTIKPMETPAVPSTTVTTTEEPAAKNLRIFRPKLQLRTSISSPTFRATPILIAPASRGRRNSKEKGLTQGKGPRATSSHSAVSRAPSPEQEATETPQQPRTKLPLQSLLLSPLGAAVSRNRSRSTSRGRISSIALSLSSSISSINNISGNKYNSTARSSVSGTPSLEFDEADEAVAELSAMVSHGQVVSSAKEQQPNPPSRSVSRFRRFSLAYLSGSEHDYDGGSEQSSRSPLRSWKSWSNRSSIASFSSASNRHSRARYSAASISTSQGSSSYSTSALEHHIHPETDIHADDRRRTSLSGSSVAELPWRQVPQQTYAHLMSSRRNSVATTSATHHWQYSQTLTHTFTATKAPSPILSATTSRSSDGSSIHSLVERVYSAHPTPAAEKEDPFIAFYMATKPKVSPLEIQAEEIRAYEKQQKEEKMLQRIANGSFFDSDDESDEEEEGTGTLDEDEDLFNHSAAHDWWMSGIEEAPEEEEDWEMPRVPSLEFDPRPQQRESSISTGTSLTTDDLHPSTPTAAEIAHYRKITELAMSEPAERRRRRRTASSECLIMEAAAEGLRTMYIEDPSDECAVEEEQGQEQDNILSAKTASPGELPLAPVKPLSLPPMSERASQRLSIS
ncbi:hypothetical protein TWF730_000429 [Orbilia blumenaviensis]|uniref:Uncharacterized protein n=1 Tax=Orbilia blumenaviensis TaxID=1796055 RepID=A0AAV9VPP2_9PEZI